ncbi:hypothetical protein HXX76_014800 [Chlamydomonas incerta]|uniref:Fungal lipase-like domain-containing protein n=1 Tax=Chlamydomonas incerta TaxID=51695 RepID=A0A835SEL3_CHLIN|nr:hypothetical protein HXX76_014800 [Chlamydomonas incerta]|eukprot:KAG2424126.1 hypothetical protein HXX76_014800 [Chlamydomonas incerta]
MAVYKVKAGRHAGATILAFEGTNSYTHGIQDLIGVAFARFGPIARVACDIYNSVRPTYVTGHSLGGCIAEVVCSRSGCGGASFNAPGPWSPNPATCIADGDRYDGVRFEIHLANGDPVSCMCNPGAGGADHGHIGSIDNGALVWHYNCGGQHGIDVMLRAINNW